jgi:IclR family transcriptional regulator, KDG regulon repressor
MNDEYYNVKVLEKALKILELYTYQEHVFTLDQITRKTGLSKATVFRILKTLEHNGFLKHDEVRQTYTLGLRFMELGGIVYESLSIRKVAAPYLDALSQDLKATILLGVLKDDQLLYIDKRESESLIRTSSYMGLKRPPYYGMLGMTLLAYMDKDEAKRLLKVYPPTRTTDKTVTDPREIVKRLEETRRTGYYVERDEIFEGVVGIGVPIRDFSGQVVAALGSSQMEFQVKNSDFEHVVERLKESAQAISRELGHS